MGSKGQISEEMSQTLLTNKKQVGKKETYKKHTALTLLS
jgi:hypothetical protein